MSITDQIKQVRSEFKTDLKILSSENGVVNHIRIKYLGRKGLVASLFVQMGSVTKEERPLVGKALNELKTEITRQIDGVETSSGNDLYLSSQKVDYTLPGDPLAVGSIHPLTQVMEEIKSILLQLGFSLAYGPEIDTEFYNLKP